MNNVTLFIIGVLVTIPASIAIGGLVYVALREDREAAVVGPRVPRT